MNTYREKVEEAKQLIKRFMVAGYWGCPEDMMFEIYSKLDDGEYETSSEMVSQLNNLDEKE